MKALLLAALLASSVLTTPSFGYERTIYIPRSVTLFSQPYQFSSDNINALGELKQRNPAIKIKFGEVALAKGDDGSIYCRGWFPITTEKNVPFGEFVKTALISELTEAGMHSDLDGQTLSLRFENIDFNTVGSGKWTFRAELSAANKKAEIFSYEHTFESAFVAATACRAVANAFVPGIQGFLRSIYKDARFYELVAPAPAHPGQSDAPGQDPLLDTPSATPSGK